MAKKARKPAKKAARKPAKKAVKKAVKKPAKKVAKKAAKKPAKKAQPQAMPKPRHGEFMWNELMTRDDERALEFFNKVLGWTHSDWPMGDGKTPYRLVKTPGGGEHGIAGMMKMTEPEFPPQVPPHWMSYIAVDNVDQRAELAKQHGGQLVHGPMDIPNVGRFCIVCDPTGATVAFMTPQGGTA
ncbi:MAG: hypothetical protein HPKKFMNG_01737 [Planctomycetes bacterium]|nr:hypothetical protein [Planctomycetota bacterium]HRJ77163.1 VOC family protein [Planctomycetota bacterium]